MSSEFHLSNHARHHDSLVPQAGRGNEDQGKEDRETLLYHKKAGKCTGSNIYLQVPVTRHAPKSVFRAGNFVDKRIDMLKATGIIPAEDIRNSQGRSRREIQSVEAEQASEVKSEAIDINDDDDEVATLEVSNLSASSPYNL